MLTLISSWLRSCFNLSKVLGSNLRNCFSGRPFFKYNMPFLSNIISSFSCLSILIKFLLSSHPNALITSICFSFNFSLILLELFSSFNIGNTFLSNGVRLRINFSFSVFSFGFVISSKNSSFIFSISFGNSFPKYLLFLINFFSCLIVWNKYQ